MKMDIKVPSVGESVQEAVLAEWLKEDGDFVEKEELLFVIETDKVTMEVPSEAEGVLEILVSEGETVPIGEVVGKLDTEAAGEKKKEKKEDKETEKEKKAENEAQTKE